MTDKRDTQLANKERRLKNTYGEEINFHKKTAGKLDFVITNQMLQIKRNEVIAMRDAKKALNLVGLNLTGMYK